jgi:hypothetical protein
VTDWGSGAPNRSLHHLHHPTPGSARLNRDHAPRVEQNSAVVEGGRVQAEQRALSIRGCSLLGRGTHLTADLRWH